MSTHDEAHLDALTAGLNDYRDAIDRILKLHTPKTSRGSECTHCGNRKWPCPTARAALAPHRNQAG